MMKTFGCKEKQRIFNGRFSRKFPKDIQKVARRKLKIIHDAERIDFFRGPSVNLLERLTGDWRRPHNIRFHDPWRAGFTWKEDVKTRCLAQVTYGKTRRVNPGCWLAGKKWIVQMKDCIFFVKPLKNTFFLVSSVILCHSRAGGNLENDG